MTLFIVLVCVPVEFRLGLIQFQLLYRSRVLIITVLCKLLLSEVTSLSYLCHTSLSPLVLSCLRVVTLRMIQVVVAFLKSGNFFGCLDCRCRVQPVGLTCVKVVSLFLSPAHLRLSLHPLSLEALYNVLPFIWSIRSNRDRSSPCASSFQVILFGLRSNNMLCWTHRSQLPHICVFRQSTQLQLHDLSLVLLFSYQLFSLTRPYRVKLFNDQRPFKLSPFHLIRFITFADALGFFGSPRVTSFVI